MESLEIAIDQIKLVFLVLKMHHDLYFTARMMHSGWDVCSCFLLVWFGLREWSLQESDGESLRS